MSRRKCANINQQPDVRRFTSVPCLCAEHCSRVLEKTISSEIHFSLQRNFSFGLQIIICACRMRCNNYSCRQGRQCCRKCSLTSFTSSFQDITCFLLAGRHYLFGATKNIVILQLHYKEVFAVKNTKVQFTKIRFSD